jgi:acyl dehydratase
MMKLKEVFFEDVEEGEEVSLTKDAITRTQIVQYAGASGDFNLMHHDERMAVGQYGEESVFAHGMISFGFVTQMLVDNFGVGTIRKHKARFTFQVRPGDILTFNGKVVKKYTENGLNLIDVDINGKNQYDNTTLIGKATLMLPSH